MASHKDVSNAFGVWIFTYQTGNPASGFYVISQFWYVFDTGKLFPCVCNPPVVGEKLKLLVFYALCIAGLTTLEEGEVSNTTISLSSKQISRMSFAKDPEVTKVTFLTNLLHMLASTFFIK